VLAAHPPLSKLIRREATQQTSRHAVTEIKQRTPPIKPPLEKNKKNFPQRPEKHQQQLIFSKPAPLLAFWISPTFYPQATHSYSQEIDGPTTISCG
jgi:hypothetical protein